MNREEELEARIRELELENGDLKGRVQVAERQVEDAKKAVQTYIDEIQKTAKGVQDMLRNTATIQTQGDMVRRRLGKVQMALLAADGLIAALRNPQGDPNPAVKTAEKIYAAAREELKTTDVQQSDDSAGQQRPAG